MRDDTPLAPLTVLAAAFALGATATWLVYGVLERRQRALQTPDDETVLKQVRERVRSVASQPDAIAVDVEQGVVRLSGEIAPSERDALLTSVLDVPGVFRIRNALGVALEKGEQPSES